MDSQFVLTAGIGAVAAIGPIGSAYVAYRLTKRQHTFSLEDNHFGKFAPRSLMLEAGSYGLSISNGSPRPYNVSGTLYLNPEVGKQRRVRLRKRGVPGNGTVWWDDIGRKEFKSYPHSVFNLKIWPDSWSCCSKKGRSHWFLCISADPEIDASFWRFTLNY